MLRGWFKRKPGVSVEKIVIGVAKGFTGQIFRFELDPEMKIKELLKFLVDKLYYGQFEPERFVLFNLSRSFEYRDEDTLSSRGTKNGEIVILLENTSCGFGLSTKNFA